MNPNENQHTNPAEERVENPVVRDENAHAAKKTKKAPMTVSFPMLIVMLCFTALITFQTTFVVLNMTHRMEINNIKKTVGKFGVLLEACDYFDANFVYDIDKDLLINHMLTAFSGQDRYSAYYTEEEFMDMIASSQGEAKGIGVYISGTATTMTVNYVMKDSPAASAGILPGDEIIAVNGHYVAEVGYAEATAMVAGESGTVVTLKISRNGAQIDVPVTRGSYTPETVVYSEITENGVKIGYIRIIQFDSITVEQFKGAMETLTASGCKGFIFDVRSNPGGELASIVDILDYLLPEGPIVHILDKDKNIIETYKSDKNEIDMPMAVLANGSTASAAELFTSAMRDYQKADIVGTKTYGKGCGQDFYMLSNGGVISITSFFYNPPFGDNYDGKGIYPNIEAELPEEYKDTNPLLLPREKDTQLKAALDALTK